MTCGFKSKWVVLVGGNTIHKWELVAIGANNSCSDVVKSASHALACSPFSALTFSFSNMVAPHSQVSYLVGLPFHL